MLSAVNVSGRGLPPLGSSPLNLLFARTNRTEKMSSSESYSASFVWASFLLLVFFLRVTVEENSAARLSNVTFSFAGLRGTARADLRTSRTVLETLTNVPPSLLTRRLAHVHSRSLSQLDRKPLMCGSELGRYSLPCVRVSKSGAFRCSKSYFNLFYISLDKFLTIFDSNLFREIYNRYTTPTQKQSFLRAVIRSSQKTHEPSLPWAPCQSVPNHVCLSTKTLNKTENCEPPKLAKSNNNPLSKTQQNTAASPAKSDLNAISMANSLGTAPFPPTQQFTDKRDLTKFKV